AACALLIATALLDGCGRTTISQPLSSTLAAPEGEPLDEIDFWHELPERNVVANGDAILGLIFLATGGSASARDAPVTDLVGASQPKLLPYARPRGWVADTSDEPAELAVRRGVIARALTDICHVKGGVMLQLLGPTERYSARELEFMGIMPPGSPN